MDFSIWTESLGYTMLHSLWQGGLIALLCYFAWRLIPEDRPRWAYHTGIAALLLMLLGSGYTFHHYFQASNAVEMTHEMNLSGVELDLTGTSVFLVAGKQTLAEQAEVFLRPFAPYLSILWVLGVLFMSLRSLGGLWQIHRLKHQARPIIAGPWLETLAPLQGRLGIRRQVTLKASRTIKAPLTMGHFKPVILIPLHMLTGLPPTHIEAMLLHELAHIRRYDFLVNLLQVWVETLFFFHPAVWWISHRVRVSREWCCDDHAALACGNKFAYARVLTTLRDPHASSVFLTVSAMGTNQDFSNRIFRLIKPNKLYTLRGSIFTGLLIATLTFGLTLWINTPQTQAQPATSAFNEKQDFSIDFDDKFPEDKLFRWMASLTDAGAEVFLHSYTVNEDKFLISIEGYVKYGGDMFILDKEQGQTQRLQLWINDENRLVGSSKIIGPTPMPSAAAIVTEEREPAPKSETFSFDDPEKAPYVIVDWAPMENPSQEKIDALDIAEMRVLDAEASIKKLGEYGRNGSIFILTSSGQNTWEEARTSGVPESVMPPEVIKTENIRRNGQVDEVIYEAADGNVFQPGDLIPDDWDKVAEISRVNEIKAEDLFFHLKPEKMPYIMIDGVPMEDPTEEKVNAYLIRHAKVLEPKKAILKYGKKARHGALSLITDENEGAVNVKVRPSDESLDPIYIIDGEVVDKSAVEALNKDQVDRINVYKGKEAIESFGEKGADGVVEIIMKGEHAPKEEDPSVSLPTDKDNRFKFDINHDGAEPVLYLNGHLINKEELAATKPAQIKSIQVYKGEQALERFGEEGRNGVVWIETKNPKKRKGADLAPFTVAPNGFTDATTIRLKLDAATDVKLDLLDVSGKFVRQIAQGTYEGDWEFKLDGSNLAPGMYYIVGEIGERKWSTKLLRK